MDPIDRRPGETDAELRIRLVDIPTIKQARNAFWRVMGMKNKDMPNIVMLMGGQRIDMADISYVAPMSGTYEISVIGKLEIKDE